MFKDIWVSYIWYNLEGMHALYSKVVLVFNFLSVVLNLIMTICQKCNCKAMVFFKQKSLLWYIFNMISVSFKVRTCTRREVLSS